MKKYKAGFAGAGHMGKILAKAAAKTGEPLALSCKTKEHGLEAAKEVGCAFAGIPELLEASEFLFLGMRPQNLSEFISDCREEIEKASCVFVSMLAGVSLSRLTDAFGPDKKIIRIMPNTPCSVGRGLIFAVAGTGISENEKKELERLLASCGSLCWIEEKDMDAVSVLGGCGPAYFYAYADAVAKAGEKMGLTKDAAIEYAAKTMLGSAAMILETGKTPGELKEEVCSPGGTTIEGVRVLEEGNLSGLAVAALDASLRKTRGM